MKFNERWVREWVDPPIDTEALAARLTAIGLEVESVESVAASMKNIGVAEIVGVTPHPEADRLSLCEVDDGGSETYHVVCGAPNVRIGMRSAFARVGARLAGGVGRRVPDACAAVRAGRARADGLGAVRGRGGVGRVG